MELTLLTSFKRFEKVFLGSPLPRRGDMSIENGIFEQLHPVGVLCLWIGGNLCYSSNEKVND